jgi:hypothetical protein
LKDALLKISPAQTSWKTAEEIHHKKTKDKNAEEGEPFVSFVILRILWSIRLVIGSLNQVKTAISRVLPVLTAN